MKSSRARAATATGESWATSVAGGLPIVNVKFARIALDTMRAYRKDGQEVAVSADDVGEHLEKALDEVEMLREIVNAMERRLPKHATFGRQTGRTLRMVQAVVDEARCGKTCLILAGTAKEVCRIRDLVERETPSEETRSRISIVAYEALDDASRGFVSPLYGYEYDVVAEDHFVSEDRDRIWEAAKNRLLRRE